MKKSFCICLLAVLCLCSCSKQSQNNTPIKTGESFTATAEIKYDDKEYTCDLNYKNNANAKLKVISPKELLGVSFALTNSELSAEYNGSSFPVPLKNNTVATARLIFSALGSAVNSSEIKTDKHNGQSYVEGEVDLHKYRLNFNGKTGLPETFEVKDLDFVCRFSDFKFVTK